MCLNYDKAALAADRYELVLGSRNICGGGAQNWSLLRHAISKGGSLYSRTWLGLPVRDLTSGTGGGAPDRRDALILLNPGFIADDAR